MKKKILVFCTYLLSLNHLSAQEAEPGFSWPKEIDTKKGVVTLYQPQLESFKNNILDGRMAISIKPPKSDMIFGAVWFNARMSTETELRTVTLEKIDIVRIHFPGLEDQE